MNSSDLVPSMSFGIVERISGYPLARFPSDELDRLNNAINDLVFDS